MLARPVTGMSVRQRRNEVRGEFEGSRVRWTEVRSQSEWGEVEGPKSKVRVLSAQQVRCKTKSREAQELSGQEYSNIKSKE